MRNLLTGIATVVLAFSLLTFGGSQEVNAQSQCDKRDAVLEILQKKYKEEPVALGVTHNGGLVEVLSTGNGTTWSIIVTTPEGMSCLVAAGEGWRAMEQIREKGDPA